MISKNRQPGIAMCWAARPGTLSLVTGRSSAAATSTSCSDAEPDAVPASALGDHSYVAYLHVDESTASTPGPSRPTPRSSSRQPTSRGACVSSACDLPTATGSCSANQDPTA